MATVTTLTKQGAFDADLMNAINTNFSNINAELAIINPSGGNINVPTGSTLTVVDSGAASFTNPKITTGVFDANGKVMLAFTPTASAVNGLGVTNSATGNGTNNAVVVQPSGTDAAIALLVEPTGAAGVLTLGLATGTGNIVVGSSSGAQSVLIANGTGAPTVQVANASTAGATVTVAGAATATGNTDTVNIATGNTAGTGAKTVHIADGTPGGTGLNVVTIGCNASAALHTTTIQGGNGAGAISLTPTGAGVITIGASAGTGDIVVGSSSGTQTTRIGNGAGIVNTNIAMVTTAGSTTAIAGAATAAGLTDTINIGLGNAAATGFKKVNIATGTPGTSGNNWVIIGGGTTTSTTVNAVAITYQAWNLATSVTGNGTTTLTFNLVDAAGNNVTLAAGLRVIAKLTTALSAGGITVALNGGSTKNLKSHFNVANNIATAYASTGTMDLMYDGTEWVDMSQ